MSQKRTFRFSAALVVGAAATAMGCPKEQPHINVQPIEQAAPEESPPASEPDATVMQNGDDAGAPLAAPARPDRVNPGPYNPEKNAPDAAPADEAPE